MLQQPSGTKIFGMSSFELLNSWNQHIKIYLCTKFQRLMAFRTQDSNGQCFVMAAIVEFKMVADPLVIPLGAGNFSTQHVKIPLYAKFHTFCRMWISLPIFVTYLPHYQTDNHASTPPLVFLQARCISCHPTNSVKALKAYVCEQLA